MNNISHRHHFIPEFFIKGFIYPSNTLWIYDKYTDKISSKLHSPKSIFFEENRNTITVSGQEIDIIEANIYKYLDNLLGKRFKIIQKASIEEIQDNELIHCIDIMAATLYYRTPSTQSFNNFSKIDIDKISSPIIKKMITQIINLQISKNDKNKLLNCIIPFINSYFFEDSPISEMQGHFKIIETKKPCFILSDNPILNESLPKDFYDLTHSIIFPLTSSRVFYGIKDKTYSLNNKIAKAINLLLAIQAKKYFGSSDELFLKKIVNGYRKIRFLKLNLQSLKTELFAMINK